MPRGRRRRSVVGRGRRRGEVEQQVADRRAVKDAVVALVAVAEQAVVAGDLAVLARVLGALEVRRRRQSKWHSSSAARRPVRSLPGSSISRRSTPAPPSAASKNSRTLRASAVGSGSAASSWSSSWNSAWIARLSAAWKRRHLLGVEIHERRDEQAVAVVLDERHDALVRVAERIIRVVRGRPRRPWPSSRARCRARTRRCPCPCAGSSRG